MLHFSAAISALLVSLLAPAPATSSVVGTQPVVGKPMLSASLVRRSAEVKSIPRAVRPWTSIIEVDRAGLEKFANAGGGLLADFPLGRSLDATLSLVPIDPFDDGAVLDIARRGPVPFERRPLRATGAFLRGSVAGVADSQAFLAVTDAGTFGFVQWNGHTYIISSGPKSRRLPTVSFDFTALPAGFIETPAWICSTVDGDVPKGGNAFAEGGVAGVPCRQVRVAFDTDFEFFQLFGSDIPAATNYVATLTSALNTIYSRDLGVRVSASYLRLWPEVDDVWTSTSTSAQLVQFRSVWATQGAIIRDTAHMLSGRSLGGGIAYAPGLCSNFGYGVSANLAGFFPTPLANNSSQNWDIFVVAHELGHNFSMPHTHSMTPPVDGCGNAPPDCAAADLDQGTLMSYCHQCAGGLTNIRLEFHPASIALALNYLNGLGCDFTGATRPPVAAADACDAFLGLPARIDVLANDEEFNCESVTISSFSATSLHGATISRSVATGSNGRDELIYSMPLAGFVGADSFTYTVRDASGLTATATVAIAVASLRTPENPVGTSSQIDAAYYAILNEVVIPDFSLRTPFAIGTVGAVNFALTFGNFATSDRSDLVGARFSGWLSVPTSGNWRLYAASDEGSRISIGASVVVDNDGVHGYSERSGVIALAAGMHAITIDYFERTGSAGLVASWQGPDGVKQAIPSTQYFRGGSNTPADLTNDGVVNAQDMAVLLSNWGQLNSPYDLSGDGVIGGADLTMVLFAWTE